MSEFVFLKLHNNFMVFVLLFSYKDEDERLEVKVSVKTVENTADADTV